MSNIYLTEKHTYKRGTPDFKELDLLCFLSKNLYNSTLYVVRQSFFKGEYKNYFTVNKEFTHSKQQDYISLPTKVSKQVQMLVDKNFKSFFALTKKKRLDDYNKLVKLPTYLPPLKGRFVVPYPQDAINKRKDGLYLSKTNIKLNTLVPYKDIKLVRVVPKTKDRIEIHIIYKKCDCKTLKKESIRLASIDLGLDNLASLVSNVTDSVLVKGTSLKSINQCYNKEISRLKSLLPKNERESKRINNLWYRRNNKINDYLHKASTKLVNHLVENNIDTLVIGWNDGIKQDISLGRINNQNFVQIPFLRFISMLEYKCFLHGIKTIRTEESYTSKASFIDGDLLSTYNENSHSEHRFSGRRIHRGLYKTKEGLLVNADLNGSANILRKVFDLTDSDVIKIKESLFRIKTLKWNP